mmetsp:Transcript_26609/g.32269  ORF Transcript_26609/g.32269 Transcript_26609/m.32269 type:complete len:112 (-) Transcript_26609:96-431(-)
MNEEYTNTYFVNGLITFVYGIKFCFVMSEYLEENRVVEAVKYALTSLLTKIENVGAGFYEVNQLEAKVEDLGILEGSKEDTLKRRDNAHGIVHNPVAFVAQALKDWKNLNP